ncbi:MAG: hypothetical protein ACO1OC_00730 [Tuberibacillus sp.]
MGIASHFKRKIKSKWDGNQNGVPFDYWEVGEMGRENQKKGKTMPYMELKGNRVPF